MLKDELRSQELSKTFYFYVLERIKVCAGAVLSSETVWSLGREMP